MAIDQDSSFSPRLLTRVKSIYGPRQVSPVFKRSNSESVERVVDTVIPELTEEEAIDNDYDKVDEDVGIEDDKESLFSDDEDKTKQTNNPVVSKHHLHPTATATVMSDKLDASMKSTQLSDAFSMVFDPAENMYNFWSTYRFLQHSPQKVIYDMDQAGENCTIVYKALNLVVDYCSLTFSR